MQNAMFTLYTQRCNIVNGWQQINEKAPIAIIEVDLKLTIGLGKPPIYIPDEEIGYLLAPNQQVRRFCNRIAINQYSMRSEEIAYQRADTTVRVLLLGDSIANGVWWTDQEETIFSLIKYKLEFAKAKVKVINASANLWVPRNKLAYVKRFGVFQSQFLVLLLNTDDLFATAPTSSPVGRDRNYPDRRPPLALAEVYSRYFKRRKQIPDMKQVLAEGWG